ncbi:25475_t:CDS:2 [Dentiscutata erythropus]|uniref:Hexosyltransferase n=1 Tax=Dentiscutata erythropus TaxID=1348616 RepID=A0A9N9F6G6_9GLOM|nr:25475_t:CDS:2 [Dentiscutata erythropus]
MTVDEKIEVRDLLRRLYIHNIDALARYLGVKKSPVSIRFISGLPRDEYKDKLEEESKMYGDIVILNITENIDEGKTFEYFKWFAKNRKDNYMVKLDDDAFLHLIHYYRDIQDIPRERVYYGNAVIDQLGQPGTYAYMGGGGYTLSRDLVVDIVGSNWANSNFKGHEDWLVGEWVCHAAKEMKYFVHYVGYSNWEPLRQYPFHDFDEYLDLRSISEIILIHQIKNIEKIKVIKDMYSEYEDGVPMVRVIWNSTTKDLVTKKELVPRCWEKEQIWDQTLKNTYKNWFYEAWNFREGKWEYTPVDNTEIVR